MNRDFRSVAVFGVLTLTIMTNLAVPLAYGGQAEPVAIVVSNTAAPVERAAADDLARALQQLYPSEQFNVVAELPESGKCIVVGSLPSAAALVKDLGKDKLANPERFIVAVTNDEKRPMAVIAGADPRGAAYGVYALLEKLGCGFYLSYDAVPPARKEAFSFDGWAMSDAPLVRERFVFNWHNFLSGCSTWNLSDWKSWIVQAQKMGYNGVMVHAYGNNPMAGFSFNGVEKPVGYLSTTQNGRDWSTQHVNDVRRLWGGFVFDGPVFGAEAAMGPDADRVAAAQQLMREVFACAKDRDINVYFAVDVDTVSANPQALIETLSADARFPVAVQGMRWMNQEEGKMYLANPDTPDGYRYYKAQVEALLRVYPQIAMLVVWWRPGGTPWTAMKLEEMPARWREEFRAEAAGMPESAKSAQAHNFFALAKIVRAFGRALKDIGRDDVQLAVGSWGFGFLPASDCFLPKDVKFIPLDTAVLQDRSQLRDADSRRAIRDVAAHRPVLPVVWAHHDDGSYVGRPYTPFADFGSSMADSAAGGFGVIHWTMRPLDLYFKSLARQVWQSTKNQPLRATCEEMAERSFGAPVRANMGEYLYRWVTEAPKIARETSDWFVDRKLADLDAAVAGCEQRLKMLDGVDAAALPAAARDRLDYFKGLERFIADLYRNEDVFRKSLDLAKVGDLAGAGAAMMYCDPGQTVERYARFSSLGGITRGEQGLVVSMNLRWLTHYISQRQAVGIELVRYNFAPTSHDPLAQSMGTFTFHFAPDQSVWECFGAKETGAAVFVLPDNTRIERPKNVPAEYEEICRTGIEFDKPLTIDIRPILARGGRGAANAAPLPAGGYHLRLLMLNPVSAAGERVVEVSIAAQSDAKGPAAKGKAAAGSPTAPVTDRIDIGKETGGANRILLKSYGIVLGQPGAIRLTLKPVVGKVRLSGVVAITAAMARD